MIGLHPIKTNHCHFCIFLLKEQRRRTRFPEIALSFSLNLANCSKEISCQLSLGLWMHFMDYSDCSIASQRNQWPNCFSFGLVDGLTTFKVPAWLEMWSLAGHYVVACNDVQGSAQKYTLPEILSEISASPLNQGQSWAQFKSPRSHDTAGMKLGTRDSVGCWGRPIWADQVCFRAIFTQACAARRDKKVPDCLKAKYLHLSSIIKSNSHR